MREYIRNLMQNKSLTNLTKFIILAIILLVFYCIFCLCIESYPTLTVIGMWVIACWKITNWIYQLADYIYAKIKEEIGE